MELFLGIDCGGSGTRAVLVDASGRIHGEGEAGPSNYRSVGLTAAVGQILRATSAAWKAAGETQRSAVRAFIGAAGVKSASDIAQVTSAIEAAGIARSGGLRVENDLTNAHAGGLAGRPGVALIAGTGSNCFGRDATGATCMVGGWGWKLDDFGGACGLALAAVRTVTRIADGRAPPSALLPALMAFLGLHEPNELLDRLYVPGWKPGELAGFAPIVIRLASQGDTNATRLVVEGANALGEMVGACVRQLDFQGTAEVVLLGGCVRSSPPYEARVQAAVHRQCPRARIVTPVYSPTLGAALNVLMYAGVQPMPTLQCGPRFASSG